VLELQRDLKRLDREADGLGGLEVDDQRNSPIDRINVMLPEAILFHENDACEDGKRVPVDLRDTGRGDGLGRCPECAALDYEAPRGTPVAKAAPAGDTDDAPGLRGASCTAGGHVRGSAASAPGLPRVGRRGDQIQSRGRVHHGCTET
jgi:hypothetical protein